MWIVGLEGSVLKILEEVLDFEYAEGQHIMWKPDRVEKLFGFLFAVSQLCRG